MTERLKADQTNNAAFESLKNRGREFFCPFANKLREQINPRNIKILAGSTAVVGILGLIMNSNITTATESQSASSQAAPVNAYRTFLPMVTNETEKHTICIQVLTNAFDPKTGEQRTFPTPCDVPKGWVIPKLINFP